MTNINIKLDETKENTDMCQAMQEIIDDVRNEYIEKNNKLIAEANEAKANEAKLRAEAKANETKLRAEAKANEAKLRAEAKAKERKLRAEAKTNETKLRAEANDAKAQIIFLKERIAQLEKIVKDQAQ